MATENQYGLTVCLWCKQPMPYVFALGPLVLYCEHQIKSLIRNDFFQYCVAPNSLAAITYWCQGKPSCEFYPEWLRSKAVVDGSGENSRLFYLQEDGVINNYLDAAQACAKFGSLANLESEKNAHKALLMISKLNASTNYDGLWIDAFTKKNFESLKIAGASGHMQDSCLVLIPNADKPLDLQLKWESCFDSQGKYGALCQAEVGPKLNHERIVDDSCLSNVETPLLEYRFHNGVKLNMRDVNCPMKVDYRRGTTT